MKWVKRILNKFNGLHYPQEYLCLTQEDFQQPLHVYLVDNNKIIKDITHSHIFIGYKPVIFALTDSLTGKSTLPKHIQIIFSQSLLSPNENLEKKDALARLFLKLISQRPAGDKFISYYESINGRYGFLSSFHQGVLNISNNLFNKRAGNIFLPGNLYTQVQIAYAVPRIISLITVAGNHLNNLFPTDLHGPLNESYYVISLRQNGKACDQVVKSRKILLSEMNVHAYKTVYSLGKNHMLDMRPKENFPFGRSVSDTLGLPIPDGALICRELELMETFNMGIHKILVFKIISRQQLSPATETLAHIHNVYATWRYHNGLPGNYLVR